MNLGYLPRNLRARVLHAVRRTWTTWRHRRISDAEIARHLAEVYHLVDPWKMQSDKEQFRFAQTNRILHDALIAPALKVGSILEIGCGEGHQSEYLVRLCDHLTGIDRVEVAVARARARVPHAKLFAGDLEAQSWAGDRARFDVVTAFEVLYYVKDVPKALETMSRLGRACIVSYYEPSAPLLERPLKRMPVDGRATFAFGQVQWHVIWWRSGM
jgi:2-polyprenyl-3-methyl-5-hydroxy-6-metoxy-1,4-benzoquinol methylase